MIRAGGKVCADGDQRYVIRVGVTFSPSLPPSLPLGDYTVGQIKDNLWSSLSDQGILTEEFGTWWDPEFFTFTYEMNKEKYELYDEQQIL